MPLDTKFIKTSAILAIIFAAINFNSAKADSAMIDITDPSNASYFIAKGVSGDGSVIVGQGTNYGFELRDGTANTILGINGSAFSSITAITAISSDGSTIVGTSRSSSSVRATRYRNGVATNLGLFAFNTSSYANATSNDGSVIVGYATRSGVNTAFKYSNGVMTSIGTIAGGSNSVAFGVSGDGSIIVGESSIAGGANHAFKHVNNIMTDLGTLGGPGSLSYAISNDGSTIVGASQITRANNSSYHAFKHVNNIMTDLGTLGGSASAARAVSGDGSIIVGESDITGNAATHAFKHRNGLMFDLGTLGGTNSKAYAISSDGKVIVGESQIAGDAATHAFVVNVSSTTIVDVNNTAAALGNNANQLNSIFNLSNTLLYTSLNQDATLFGKNNIALEIGGRYSSIRDRSNVDNSNQSGATLKIAYRFNPHLRAGIFLDQSLSNNMPSNFSMQKSTPIAAIFTTLSQEPDGSAAQIRLAAAYSSADLQITREVLTHTEAGRGKSSLVSKGALAEFGYGFKFSEKTLLQPYLGLRFMQTVRDSYTENSGADFPISFQKAEKKSTTSFFGTRLLVEMSSKLQGKFSVGYERDLTSSLDGYAGNISYLGSFDLTPTNVRKNRAFASFGLNYNIAELQKIGAELFYTKQALNSADGATVYLHYAIGF